MFSSRYHDEEDSYGTENSTVTLRTAPPMSTFRTLPGRRCDEALEHYHHQQQQQEQQQQQQQQQQERLYDEDDHDGFTEGHFLDEPQQQINPQNEKDDHHVDIDPWFSQQGQQTNTTNYRRNNTNQRKATWIVWFAVVVILLVLTTLLLSMLLVVSPRSSSSSPPIPPNSSSPAPPDYTHINVTINNNNNNNNPTVNGTIISSVPSSTPSLAPIPIHPQEQLNHILDLATLWSGEDALQDSSSSATKALQWLLFQDPFQLIINTTVTDWYVQQRYVAAVLYFAMLDTTTTNTIFHDTTFLSGIDVCSWNIWNQQEQPTNTGGDNAARGIFCNTGGDITEVQLGKCGKCNVCGVVTM
jgi:hypothetical protein